MSKTWKWILGIVVVVVVLGALAMAGFAWRSNMSYRGGDLPYARDWNNMPMYRDNDWNNWNHPMMSTRGFVPFGGFFLLGGLVKSGLFLGLLYGAYWLGRRNARIALDPKPGTVPDTKALNKPVTPEVNAAPAPRRGTKKTG